MNGNGVRIFTNAGAANGTFALHPQQLATPGARGAASRQVQQRRPRRSRRRRRQRRGVHQRRRPANFGEPDSTPPVITAARRADRQRHDRFAPTPTRAPRRPTARTATSRRESSSRTPSTRRCSARTRSPMRCPTFGQRGRARHAHGQRATSRPPLAAAAGVGLATLAALLLVSLFTRRRDRLRQRPYRSSRVSCVVAPRHARAN